MNSIGHLVLHLEGNLAQWVIDPLKHNSNHREREKEFRANNTLSREESIAKVLLLSSEMSQVLANFPEKQLIHSVQIQGRTLSYLSAIYAALTHLEGHVGQIMYITHQLKGDSYRLFDEYGLNEQLGDYIE